jgi:sporulation protein YlmC with PRC-barrel domain
MTEMTLVIGSEAHTADGKISGYVKSVVVDRGARTVTHLVVEPKGREGLARLVRLDDQVDAQDGTIRLGYTEAEFRDLAAAEDVLAEVLGSGPVEVVPEGWRPADDEPVVDGDEISPARAMFRGEIDLVPVLLPAGEEEHLGDGEIGQLRALSIDPGTHRVTHVHVLLKEGLLRRHQDVAIPAESVSGFTGGIRLSISREQVAELAPSS